MTLMGLSLFQCSSLLPREGCSTIQPSHSFNCSRMFLSSGNISIVHQISLRPFSWITPIAPSGTRASGKISWPSGKQTCVPLLALLSSSHVVIFVSIFCDAAHYPHFVEDIGQIYPVWYRRPQPYSSRSAA